MVVGEKEIFTTIRIRQGTKKKLDSVKVHPRETYEDVILRMIKMLGEQKT